MSFQPNPEETLNIADITYRVTEHPSAPALAYGQEGRQAIVYQLITEGTMKFALKVFKPRFRNPSLVSLTENIKGFATFPGMQICKRKILTPQNHKTLLRSEPALIYAVLMPWVDGPTWTEIISSQNAFSPRKSLELATNLANLLTSLEQENMAHCDLSGSNIIISDDLNLALVDVEGIHAPGLPRPSTLPAGSPGYAPKSTRNDLWSPQADRFAGAVLLAEILGWSNKEIRENSWGESYFDPREMEQKTKRYDLMVRVLDSLWGEGIANLFRAAWQSPSLSECPTMGQWLLALPDQVPDSKKDFPRQPQQNDGLENKEYKANLDKTLVDLGQKLEQAGNDNGTLDVYIKALKLFPEEKDIANKIDDLISNQIGAPAVEETSENKRSPSISYPLPRMTTAQMFDDGLEAYKEERWQAAKEMLGEVVRRNSDYERKGWRANKLLENAEEKLISTRQKIFRYAGRIGLSSALVFSIVTAIFMGLYVTLARPIVEDSVFLILESTLNKTVEMSDSAGCFTGTETQVENSIKASIPSLKNESVDVKLTANTVFIKVGIDNRPVWIMKAEPFVEEARNQPLRFRNLEMSWPLHLLFSKKEFLRFSQEYFNENLFGPENPKLSSIEIGRGMIIICTSY